MFKIACNKSIKMEVADPVATVPTGKLFTVETINAYGDKFENMAELLALIRGKNGNAHHHPLTGPIYIEGARAGDVLRVDIESIRPYEMAQTLSRSAGIDPIHSSAFCDRAPIIGKIIKERVHYTGDIELPYMPMVGIIGTAPKSGFVKTGHAATTGGNLDIPFITEGCSIYLPVEVDGAYLYLGDVHSAQGYGELGGIAMECSADVVISVHCCKPSDGLSENDTYLEVQKETTPIMVAGIEPLSGKCGIGVVGVSKEFNDLNQAVADAYQGAVIFMKQLCPSLSWGVVRNLVTLVGHSINGQAGSKTAESTSMIFFTSRDLANIYRTSGDVLSEILDIIFPIKKGEGING